jgi:hypothetical protein
MQMDKLQRAGALCKETRQGDSLSDAAARALQTISQVVVENPNDPNLKNLLESFRRALQAYDDGIDTNPAEAARQFGREIDRIIRERSLAMAVRSSLEKGMSPFDFWKR